jgi:hypothetical protein
MLCSLNLQIPQFDWSTFIKSSVDSSKIPFEEYCTGKLTSLVLVTPNKKLVFCVCHHNFLSKRMHKYKSRKSISLHKNHRNVLNRL